MATKIYGGRQSELALQKYLDRHDREISSAFIALWLQQARDLSESQILAASERGRFSERLFAAWTIQVAELFDITVLPRQEKAGQAAGRPLARAITRHAKSIYRYDPVAIAMLEYLEENAARSIAGISEGSANALNHAIKKTVTENMNRPTLIKFIKQNVGLDERYAKAVDRRYQLLFRQGQADGLTDTQAMARAIKFTERYSRKLHNTRAHNIARTEIGKGWSYAETETMKDAISEGFFGKGPDMIKEWFTALDERVCTICGPLHGTVVEYDRSWSLTRPTKDGPVDIRGPVDMKLGSTEYAMAHNECRCTQTWSLR